jgi:hypothetical protein
VIPTKRLTHERGRGERRKKRLDHVLGGPLLTHFS